MYKYNYLRLIINYLRLLLFIGYYFFKLIELLFIMCYLIVNFI